MFNNILFIVFGEKRGYRGTVRAEGTEINRLNITMQDRMYVIIVLTAVLGGCFLQNAEHVKSLSTLSSKTLGEKVSLKPPCQESIKKSLENVEKAVKNVIILLLCKIENVCYVSSFYNRVKLQA